MNKMNLPKNVLIALDRLGAKGFQAGVVGGCVRDHIMGEIPHDYDITTSASPTEIKEIFNNFNVLTVGEKHGTVTPVINGETIEITTYRIDGDYSDGRRPDSVSFTKNLEEDLLRRDFTMNAICFNGIDFIDPFNGISDINKKIIRCVGNPDERFTEDSLRILRAMRFASKTGFEIDKDTEAAMFKHKHLLSNVSEERISQEFIKILNSPGAVKILKRYVDIFIEFIPEFEKLKDFDQKNSWHVLDIWNHTLQSIESLGKNANLKLKLVMLFHDIGKPNCYSETNGVGHFYLHQKESAKITEEIFKRLKITSADNIDKDMIKDILMLIEFHDAEVVKDKRVIVRDIIKNLNGNKNLYQEFLYVKMADSSAQNLQLAYDRLILLKEVDELYNDLLYKNLLYTKISDLAISGKDLINLGYTPGLELGKTLNNMLDNVSVWNIKNTKEALIKSAKRRLIKNNK